MITVNVDNQDGLINDQAGDFADFESQNNKNNSVVSIEKYEADFYQFVRETFVSSIKKNQFPIALSCICAIHKAQGLSFEEVVADVDSTQQK